jgi:hypothetical protein
MKFDQHHILSWSGSRRSMIIAFNVPLNADHRGRTVKILAGRAQRTHH